ncbi:hypothetical protein [Streptomyces sp. MUSC 14]|uniref:hypothetical protein n=1 Tax=Streptomyces sp. MUSC 14 TaxID=1354889 RepID=UPI000AFA6943|nr:hypothetical protein [Streptomyces sp. MUSC 14]
MNPDRTDDELARLDMGVLLRYGLTAPPGPRRTALFGDGAAGAAVLLDRLGTQPRSVAFLADTVRAGGLAYAAGLPEPLPHPEAAVGEDRAELTVMTRRASRGTPGS